jgi:hypothetical protein
MTIIKIYVLIMIFGGASSQSGYATIQQEFNTMERCESARKFLAQRHEKDTGNTFTLQAQGCFEK